MKKKVNRVTIYDIAELIETSATTVSAVLNGSWKKRRISEKLANRILRVADEKGYSVNTQASLLRRKRSNIIGMIIPKYDNRYFASIAENFEILSRKNGLFPVITCAQRDPNLEMIAARELISYQVDSLILTGATAPDAITSFCQKYDVKTINLDLPGELAPSVISDNYEGALSLTRFILNFFEKRYACKKNLIFVGGRASDYNTSHRVAGFIEAHKEKGIKVPRSHILTCGYAADKAKKALKQYEKCAPLGLFINSTISLDGVSQWVNQLPKDIANNIHYGVFDWDPFAVFLPQNIVMIKQNIPDMLAIVFEYLLNPQKDQPLTLVPCVLCPSPFINTHCTPSLIKNH